MKKVLSLFLEIKERADAALDQFFELLEEATLKGLIQERLGTDKPVTEKQYREVRKMMAGY